MMSNKSDSQVLWPPPDADSARLPLRAGDEHIVTFDHEAQVFEQSVNYHVGEDVVLHVVIRKLHAIIVINDFVGGVWGTERHLTARSDDGLDIAVRVLVQEDGFRVSSNGEEFVEFKPRRPIQGNVELRKTPNILLVVNAAEAAAMEPHDSPQAAPARALDTELDDKSQHSPTLSTDPHDARQHSSAPELDTKPVLLVADCDVDLFSKRPHIQLAIVTQREDGSVGLRVGDDVYGVERFPHHVLAAIALSPAGVALLRFALGALAEFNVDANSIVAMAGDDEAGLAQLIAKGTVRLLNEQGTLLRQNVDRITRLERLVGEQNHRIEELERLISSTFPGTRAAAVESVRPAAPADGTSGDSVEQGAVQLLAPSFEGVGLHEPQSNGRTAWRWLSRNAGLVIRNKMQAREIRLGVVAVAQGVDISTMFCTLNGTQVQPIWSEEESGRRTITINVPEGNGVGGMVGVLRLSFKSAFHAPGDERPLTIACDTVTLLQRP